MPAYWPRTSEIQSIILLHFASFFKLNIAISLTKASFILYQSIKSLPYLFTHTSILYIIYLLRLIFKSWFFFFKSSVAVYDNVSNDNESDYYETATLNEILTYLNKNECFNLQKGKLIIFSKARVISDNFTWWVELDLCSLFEFFLSLI